MKVQTKSNIITKNKFYIILVILLVVVSSLITYFYVSNKDEDKNNNKNNDNQEVEIPSEYISLLCKPNTYYSNAEKSWNDFEWLQLIPEYPEKNKIIGYEEVEGEFIKIYYKNVNLKKVQAWADSLLNYGFYENKKPEETDDYIAIKRRNKQYEIRANPYYFYEDGSMTIFVNRTEYQKDMQDAEWYFSQNEVGLPCTPTHQLGKIKYNSDDIIEYIP